MTMTMEDDSQFESSVKISYTCNMDLKVDILSQKLESWQPTQREVCTVEPKL